MDMGRRRERERERIDILCYIRQKEREEEGWLRDYPVRRAASIRLRSAGDIDSQAVLRIYMQLSNY